MSQSYPFLHISRQLGVPYSEVASIADYWFKFADYHRVFEPSLVADRVMGAVSEEKKRRAKVAAEELKAIAATSPINGKYLSDQVSL